MALAVPGFRTRRPMIGVIHLPPLPGAARRSPPLERIRRRALDDARALAEGGADGMILENFGDAPFAPGPVDPHVPAFLAVLASELRTRFARPVGINVLRNDPRAALAAAAASGATFIRINVHVGAMMTDQGLIEGRAHHTLQYRRQLGVAVSLFADVLVKHASPVRAVTLAQAARETAYRGLADALLITGSATGEAPEPARLEEARRAVPDRPLLVASGITPDNLESYALADGFVVGTFLQRAGRTENPVEPARVRRLVRALRRLV